LEFALTLPLAEPPPPYWTLNPETNRLNMCVISLLRYEPKISWTNWMKCSMNLLLCPSRTVNLPLFVIVHAFFCSPLCDPDGATLLGTQTAQTSVVFVTANNRWFYS
jgi:hypothetical protein